MPYPRSQLTFSQQSHVRARMMASASKIVSQLDQFLERGKIVVAGKEVLLTTERLQAYRLILDRTVPTLHSTEIQPGGGLEGLDSEQLVQRLAELAKGRPELRDKLYEAMGGRLIEAEVVESSAAVESGS